MFSQGLTLRHPGAMNFLPLFDINIFPFGNFLIPIYGLVLAYAILKHQLLDIVIVIRKSMIYSSLITIISILYLIMVFLLERFAQEIFGYQSLIISIGTAFGLGLIFIPLKHQIQRFVDRYFLKGTHEEIAQENVLLRQEIAQSEKYKTLSTLSSGIAHEVKNPLTAIKTFCEYLPRKVNDKEFLIKFSNIVGHEVDRINDMVHQLLDYGKPAPLAIQKTNIHKLINDTIDILNSKFIAQKITINKALILNPRPLTVDPNQIKQALLNIFLNAVDAMPSGGTLTISTTIDHPSAPKINSGRDLAQISNLGGLFTINIHDTGSGIPKESLKHIFDPFFSKKDSGTGLGLSITQSIIENHGGTIRIKSDVGIGTNVEVKLPLAQTTPKSPGRAVD